MKQTIKTGALVVYGSRWSETSKIIHFFTEERGYIKAIAHGALRPKSPFQGVLENLNQVEIILSLKEGRGLQIVTQVDLIDSFGKIRDNLDAMAVSYAILELIRSMVHFHEPAHRLFGFTVSILKSLNRQPEKHVLIYLFSYLFFLSDYLGFGWDLASCKVCGKDPEKFPLKADVENGSVICAGCSPATVKGRFTLSQEQWFFLWRLQETEPEQLPDLVRDMLPDVMYQPLLDMLLAHINYHTEQTVQLKSLKMYLP
jgi:DNA repair protein RecO (recombination protein O)